MNKLVVMVVSLAVVGCQSQPISQQLSPLSQQSSSLTQKNNIVQRYANKLVKLGNSDNFLIKDVVLYRVNGTKDTNLTFVYNSTKNHIKAVLMNCTTEEAEEIAYYPINEITERVFVGYLPPNDAPQATPVKHEPPIPISIPALGYSLACQ